MSHIFAVYIVKKNPHDRQRNCPKHVEFYSKNKFEKLVHLVGFIIRIYHDARSPEGQKNFEARILCTKYLQSQKLSCKETHDVPI